MYPGFRAVNRTPHAGEPNACSPARRLSGLDLGCDGGCIPFTAQEDPPSMSVAAANYPSRSSIARHVTETSLALASIGLVGLHVVDDNFLQPEPGMTAVDHLPGGLTLVALIAAGAWAYRRARPGARAALALLLGFFGVLAGIEAV